MTEDDTRTMIRNLQTFIAARFDAFENHLSGMEAGWANWAKDNGHRMVTLEERIQSLEARIASLEGN